MNNQTSPELLPVSDQIELLAQGLNDAFVAERWTDVQNIADKLRVLALRRQPLPPLPPSLDEVHVYMGERSDDHTRWATPNAEYFNADQMRAYGELCRTAAKPEAVADREALGRALALSHIGKGRSPRWVHVGALTSHGSGYSIELCRRFGLDPYEVLGRDDKVTWPTHTAAPVPADSVMVPREPTEAMLEAVRKRTTSNFYDWPDIYKAFIAVAQETER